LTTLLRGRTPLAVSSTPLHQPTLFTLKSMPVPAFLRPLARSLRTGVSAAPHFSRDISTLCVTYLPGRSGYAVRRWYWKRRLAALGDGARIEPGVIFQNPEYISIGRNCWIDRDVTLLAGQDKSARGRMRVGLAGDETPGTIVIGDNTHIGIRCILSGIDSGIRIGANSTLSANCALYAFTHHYRSALAPDDRTICFGSMVPHDRQYIITGAIDVGENTGMALNAVVLPGVNIAGEAFVHINTVVKAGLYPRNCRLEGQPATVVGPRFTDGAADAR
jgi:acetyltransferase-like isoleucine patch superfamily enzyme